ncbi:Uncharacterised protein [Mycobacteroides abscessus subsp. abscessus]|nr:Uncharacterised protein [Mycobacteroides abscessus subsp. abscessus]
METTAVRRSGFSLCKVVLTAFSAACCALVSMVVVICRPSVFKVCSSMLNRSVSSAITWRLIRPLGPVVAFCAAACSGGTVAGYTCPARS